MDFSTRKWVTVEELAMEAGISKNWIYQRTRRDALPGLRRFGKHVRIDWEVFRAALEEGSIS